MEIIYMIGFVLPFAIWLYLRGGAIESALLLLAAFSIASVMYFAKEEVENKNTDVFGRFQKSQLHNTDR